MNKLQQALAVAGLVLNFILILLALRKGQRKICYSFFAYLTVSFVSSLIVIRTNSRQFYVAKEIFLDLLTIAIVLELNRKIFKLFPRVRMTNFLGLVGSILFFLIYHWLTPQTNVEWWYSLRFDMHSKILQTACAVFLIMTGSILYYRLQITIPQKYLILGFLVSQFPMALGFAIAATTGRDSRIAVSYFNSIFFVLALAIWARVYWQYGKNPDPIPSTGGCLDNPHDPGKAQ
jgi:hypothetical protein